MRKSTKISAVLGGAALTVATAGVAFAYWSTSGTGTGTADTSAGAASLVITQTAAPSNLAPGVAAGGITVTVKNTASNNAYVAKVTASIASVTQAVGATGTCSASDYDLSNPEMTNGAGDLASGSTATFSGATLGFHNSASNQDGCKGATVNLSYAVS